MTPDEILTMSRVVAQRFGLWTPGRTHCPFPQQTGIAREGACIKCLLIHPPYPIPCPDLTQPEWFVRLLKALKPDMYFKDDDWWVTAGAICEGATELEHAVLRAAYQLVQREAAK